MADASVIGLGMMGATLARLLLRHGYRVTVWNRTAAKADQLVREGAILAPDAAAAVSASPITIVCVHDYKATQAILDMPAVDAALTGRVLLQLSTGSPREARDSEAWARARGAAYVAGAIQAAPEQMGKPDTPIFVSGAEEAFRRSEAVLKIFGGGITNLGEQVGAAPAMDLASLSYVYGAIVGFLHGARVAESEGFRVDTYGALVAAVAPSFGQFLQHESTVIQSGNFAVSQSPLKISVEAVDRLLETAHAAGIDTGFPAFASALFRRGATAGYGDEELAALIKVMRTRSHAGVA